ncbi:hypothetical protein GCM10009557_70570 [Virgisporangium ochraceum]|uniref:Lipoprotein n=1 Tax=Virgisporangium ochraceum TaxID=65505 RepID=A0A8J4A2Z2_9ACTN|nr:hypothetical protein [Virgisporangium ochraceum]GIJ73597.1 lipoprotein [Virgisporangium ochraceum]
MTRIGPAAIVGLVCLAVAVALAGCSGTGDDPTPARAEVSVPGATEVVTPSAVATTSATPTTRTVAVPSGFTAGVAVYDRQAAAFTVRHNADQRFRSASLVKLLIAVDYLLTHRTIPAADKPRLDIMLSRSDDAAASHFYTLGGRTAVIARMNALLGIDVVPPTAPRTGWGSTEVSAAHLVRVYRYLLDEAPPHIGQYVVGRLRTGTFTRCGTDGYDQSFGIPTAFAGQPWAAKQGWYEFAAAPKTCRSATPAALAVEAAAPVGAAPVDWTGEALHTTGIVGPNDRSIVVVLTVHPRGTSYATATAAVTAFAKALPLTG